MARQFQDFLVDASAGDSAAQYYVGWTLMRHQRLDEAMAWLNKAAAQGHVAAQVELARSLLYFVETGPSIEQAVELLEQAERAGSSDAAYQLALLAVCGRAVSFDNVRVARQLAAAAHAGNTAAIRALALCYGAVAQSGAQSLAMHLLGHAAALGDPICAQLLAARQNAEAADTSTPDPDEDIPVEEALEIALRSPSAQPLSEKPSVRRIDNLLNAEECRVIMAMAEPLLKPSRIVQPESGEAAELSRRNSSDAAFDAIQEDMALRLLQRRMASAAGQPIMHAEPLVVLRYRPGERYLPHRDYLGEQALQRMRPEAGQRQTTLCAYLSPVAGGGETDFPKAGLSIAPVAGSAVAFENLDSQGRPDPDSLHAGLPVTAGEKWLATLWIRQRPFRTF